VALLGAQIELVTKQFLNNIPSRAILSILGVLLISEPYALIAWDAWSSADINIILGRLFPVPRDEQLSNCPVRVK
jgi:hypothetical protein